jgi:hypothetical protein
MIIRTAGIGAENGQPRDQAQTAGFEPKPTFRPDQTGSVLGRPANLGAV